MSEKEINQPEKKRKKESQIAGVMKRLKRNKFAMAGLVIIILLILVAIFADVLAPYGYAEQDLKNTFASPSAGHLCGTDKLGRDVFSRLIYGARESLMIGFLSVLLAASIGMVLGALAGFYGGVVDNLLMRFLDIYQSIPNILLSMVDVYKRQPPG